LFEDRQLKIFTLKYKHVLQNLNGVPAPKESTESTDTVFIQLQADYKTLLCQSL
jgi:hypothetical protein